ncbi:MAG: LamG domain-containing protein [Gelidibacter sp.]
MKNLIFKILVSALLFLGCSDSDEQPNIQQLNCLTTNLQNGVVAFYPFNNGSINDESGNNNHLNNTTTASATVDRNGNPNCAFQFNSSNNEFLTFTNPMFLNDLQDGSLSISLWYLSENEGAGLISRGNDLGNCAGGLGEWNLSLWDNNWINFHINGYRIIGVTPNPEVVQLNEWHHIVVTSDITDLKVYQDGVLIEDSELVICGPTPSLNVGDFFIGAGLTGKLDDIIIYNNILSQTDITELYNLSPCCN